MDSRVLRSEAILVLKEYIMFAYEISHSIVDHFFKKLREGG